MTQAPPHSRRVYEYAEAPQYGAAAVCQGASGQGGDRQEDCLQTNQEEQSKQTRVVQVGTPYVTAAITNNATTDGGATGNGRGEGKTSAWGSATPCRLVTHAHRTIIRFMPT